LLVRSKKYRAGKSLLHAQHTCIALVHTITYTLHVELFKETIDTKFDKPITLNDNNPTVLRGDFDSKI